MKKAYGTYRTPSEETVSALWVPQKEKEKGTESVYKAIMAENEERNGHTNP